MTAWEDVLETGDIKAARYLIASGGEVNKKNGEGKTLLMCAILEGHTDIVELLLESGSDINAKDEYDETPLMYAVEYADIDVIRLLIENGADINAIDEHSRTPLMYALWEDVEEYNDEDDDEYRTPYIAKDRRLDIVLLLLEKGAEINAKDEYFIDHHDPFESGTDFLHLLQIEQIAGRSIRTRNKEEVRACGLFQHIVRNIEIRRQRDPDAFRALKARQRRIQRIRRIETCQRMVFIAETPRQDRQQIVRTVARDDIFRGIAVNGSDLFPQGGRDRVRITPQTGGIEIQQGLFYSRRRRKRTFVGVQLDDVGGFRLFPRCITFHSVNAGAEI